MTSPEPMQFADIIGAPVKVPGKGFVRHGDLTADDLRARADAYRRMGGKRPSPADEWDGTAARMEAEGVSRLADLATVPPRPQEESRQPWAEHDARDAARPVLDQMLPQRGAKLLPSGVAA